MSFLAVPMEFRANHAGTGIWRKQPENRADLGAGSGIRLIQGKRAGDRDIESGFA